MSIDEDEDEDEDEEKQLAQPVPTPTVTEQPGPTVTPEPAATVTPEPVPPQRWRVHVQTAQAAESAVIVQVGGDLYLSDAALAGLWTPAATTPGECPYPGLDAFGPGQARWFFGREAVTGELLRHLDAMARGGPGMPLLVVAPSGTGKSSLLGAGLLSALAEGRLGVSGSAAWPRLVFTPGARPVRTLRSALGTLASVATTAGDSRVVVVIDQLEEVFTVCESEAERLAFFDEISTMAADAGPGSALVVLGMRSDFYTRATAYPVLRRAMQSRQVVLGAMSAAEVRQAIVRPARAAGLTLEDGLTERLLHDLGVDEGDVNGLPADSDRTADAGLSAGGGYEPGRLPLLAHALRATWQHRDGTRLTLAGYAAAGGIAGAIARTAEDVYARLDEPGQLAARQLFLALVRVGQATGDGSPAADTRRRLAADGLLSQAGDPPGVSSDVARAALAAFTAARLLTSGGQAVEITHEALLRRWPRLRGWIDEDRAGLLVRQELEDAAASWSREGRDAAALYGGVRLASAQAWADTPGRFRELTQTAKEFLAASVRRRRRGTRRRNGVIAVLAALSLVLAGLSVFALNQRSAAQATSRTAEAGLLAAEAAQAWADYRPDTGVQFAAEADVLDPSSSAVRSTLLTSQATAITGRLLANGAPEGSNMVSVAYNPAGTLIAGTTGTTGPAADDDKVELWSAATYRLLWSFQFPKIDGKRQSANEVAFSPDGKTMVVAQQGGPWLFDVSNHAHPVHTGTLAVPAVRGNAALQVVDMAVSKDGTMVAASVASATAPAAAVSPNAGYVLLWNVATHDVAGVIPEGSLAESIAFTPDGRSLLVSTIDGGVDLWDVRSHTRTAVLRAGTPNASPVLGAAVSPDGSVIAFNALTGSTLVIEFWNTATRRVVATAKVGAAGEVNSLVSVVFSPDGRELATTSQDGTVRLWQGTELLGNFYGHRDQVNQAAFSPDGATLATASSDGTIDLWNTRGPILDGQGNPAASLAFSPDGKTLAINTFAAGQYGVALYSMPGGKLTGVLPLPADAIAQVAFSPDGKTLAVQPDTPGDPVELWDVATGRMTGQVTTGFSSTYNAIAFSPDGTLLAVSGFGDAIVQVWSTTRLARVATFSDTQQSNLPPQQAGVNTLAFSPDGRLLTVVGSDEFVRVYAVPGFALLDIFQPPDPIDSLAFSPDGRDLALGSSDGNVYLYAVPARSASLNGKIVSRGTFSASTKGINSVEFLSDNTLIAGGNDAVVRFWNVPSGNNFTATIPAQTIATHWGAIADMSYSASLGLLATASASGSRVWDTNPARIAANICQTLKAPVQPALWNEYLPDIPYTPVCG